jgi:MHS family proline/betaine transporter-like MFS transporter
LGVKKIVKFIFICKMIEKKSIWSIITASSLGTVIEWYDFYIFGSLAPIIATQFFPKENPTAAFLATLAAFGVGFVIRPFGALVFGRLGDLMGRKSTFLLTLILMGVSTFAIGLIPSYESIGVLAPIIVFVLRAVQGLALGGEYGGAAIYVAEHAPEGKKGYFTSFIQTTATFGLLLSLAVILLCKYFVPEGQFEEWGWRLPFLVSVILVIVSYFIRTKMDESPVFQQMKAAGKTAKNPLKESFTKWKNLKLVLIALFGAAAGQGVIWYTGQFYAMNFSIKTLHIQEDQIQYMLIPVLLLATPFFIVFAKLSDRIGRKKVMMTGVLLAILLYIPIYKQMSSLADWRSWEQNPENYHTQTSYKETDNNPETSKGFVTVTNKTSYINGCKRIETMKLENSSKGRNAVETKQQIFLSSSKLVYLGFLIFIQLIFVCMVYGPIAAFLVELFPPEIRYTSLSLPYHIGNGVFGGLTPLIAEILVLKFNNPLAGLWYPIAIGAITFVVGMIFLTNSKKSVHRK